MPDFFPRNRGVCLNAGTWAQRAMSIILNLTRGWQGTAEDIRYIIEERIGEAPEPNIFGHLIREAKKKQTIITTGEYRPMRDEKANGRSTPVYFVP